MKNILKIIGITALLLVVGFSMASCDLGGKGTIIVKNSGITSPFNYDNPCTMSLYQGTSLIAGPREIPIGYTWTVSDCPSGVKLELRVTDRALTTRKTTFTLKNGETKNITYTGTTFN
jgi:hypothetical protein